MKIIPAMRHCAIAFVVLAGLSVATVTAKPLAVLSQVHDGADAVVVVPSLRQLSDKMVLLANALGMGAQLPPDPLMMLKMMGQLGQGLDDNGNVGLVIYDAQPAIDAMIVGGGHGAAKEPKFVLLIPVTDATAFMANFANQQPADMGNDIQKITIMGGPMMVKTLNDQYVAISDKVESINNYKPAKADHWTDNQGKIAQKYTDSSDLIFLFNPKTLGNLLTKYDVMIRAGLKAEWDKAGQRTPEMKTMRPLLDYYFDLLLKAANTAIKDTSGIAMGLTITEAGISNGMSFQFKDGSTLNKILAKTPNTLGQFDSLPDLPWVTLTLQDVSHLDEKLLLGLIKQMIPSKDLVAEEYHEIVDQAHDVFENYTLYEYVVEQLQVSNAAGANQVIAAIKSKDDSRAVFQQIRQLIQPIMKLVNAILASSDEETKDKLTTSLTENIQVTNAATSTDLLTVTGKDEVATALAASFGGPSIEMYYSHNNDGTVFTMGDKKFVEQALKAVSAKQVPANYKAVVDGTRPNLPDNRMMEMYISLPNYLQQMQTTMLRQPGGAQAAMMIGMFQLPPDTAPMAYTASNVNGGMSMDGFVPMSTIAALAQKGMMLQQMMMGPGNAPGNPPAENGDKQDGAPPAPFH